MQTNPEGKVYCSPGPVYHHHVSWMGGHLYFVFQLLKREIQDKIGGEGRVDGGGGAICVRRDVRKGGFVIIRGEA